MNRLLYLTVLACCMTWNLSAAPVPKDRLGKILIVAMKGEKSQLVLIDEDGKNPKPLTEANSNAISPAWSPDGSKIAFASDRVGGIMQIFVMDADGKNVTQLTQGDLICRVPSWSPDAKYLYISRGTQFGSSEICRIDADGKNPTVIGMPDAWDPAVSPDGKQLAFASTREVGGFRLYSMDIDGSNTKLLYEAPNVIGAVYPAWSPNGKQIAFGHLVDGNVELHIIDADGKNPKQITKFGGRSVYPAWSPKGDRIAVYQYREAASAELVILDREGKNRKVILKDVVAAESGRPQWRPK